MTETTTRINWRHDDAGNLFGYAGGTAWPLFTIDAPLGSLPWTLATCLPIPEAERGDGTGTPDELKAEAERWLAEFVTSLGASFPEDEVDPFGPDAWLDHHPDCVCPDCQGAREEAAKAAGEKE